MNSWLKNNFRIVNQWLEAQKKVIQKKYKTILASDSYTNPIPNLRLKDINTIQRLEKLTHANL